MNKQLLGAMAILVVFLLLIAGITAVASAKERDAETCKTTPYSFWATVEPCEDDEGWYLTTWEPIVGDVYCDGHNYIVWQWTADGYQTTDYCLPGEPYWVYIEGQYDHEEAHR